MKIYRHNIKRYKNMEDHLNHEKPILIEIMMYKEYNEIKKDIPSNELEKEIENLVKDLEDWFNEEDK
jgi:hypothetical protein